VPTITIKDRCQPIATQRGTILDAALAAGVLYPHGCRVGECGSCKSKLLSGEVAMKPCLPDALSADERAQGWILACRAIPKVDVEVAWADDVSAGASDRCRLRAEVVALARATHDIVRVRLRPHGEFNFAAGQFARLHFDNLPARPYSMASLPGERELEFHIRYVPDGLVSGFCASRLCLGTHVELEGPFGSATLQADAGRPLLLAAGGSGLAPIKSILRAAISRNHRAPIALYHGVRDVRDVYDITVLQRLARDHDFALSVVLSSPTASRDYRTGLVHEAIGCDFGSLASYDVHVAGPPPMVDAVKKVAVERGAQPERLFADAFYGANPAPREGEPLRRGLFTRWFAPREAARHAVAP
jgi:naphthalene 1,2-dioxygenase ferredoxin reductase component